MGPAEPNNQMKNELCAVANFTQGYIKAAGWQDVQCNITAPAICRVQRKAASVAACPLALLHST